MSDEIETIYSKQDILDNKLPVATKTVSATLSRTVPDKSNSKLLSTGSTVCRICHTNTVNEPLISPCNCRGTLAYVHLSCLERWLNQSSRSYCELCMYHYNSVETKRYKLFESIRLWVRHPRNRGHVKSDLLIGMLLTLVSLGLVVICLFGMEYFVMEGNKIGIQKRWIRFTICLFLAIVLLGYLVTIYMLIRDQVKPWYNWWKKTVNVKLQLSPSIIVNAKVHRPTVHRV